MRHIETTFWNELRADYTNFAILHLVAVVAKYEKVVYFLVCALVNDHPECFIGLIFDFRLKLQRKRYNKHLQKRFNKEERYSWSRA